MHIIWDSCNCCFSCKSKTVCLCSPGANMNRMNESMTEIAFIQSHMSLCMDDDQMKQHALLYNSKLFVIPLAQRSILIPENGILDQSLDKKDMLYILLPREVVSRLDSSVPNVCVLISICAETFMLPCFRSPAALVP